MQTWRRGGEILLIDLLRAIEALTRDYLWTLDPELDVAPSPEADKFYDLPTSTLLTTEQLEVLASPAAQVLEGEIVAVSGAGGVSEITIRAVRGGWWDVESANDEVLSAVVAAFPHAMPLPK